MNAIYMYLSGSGLTRSIIEEILQLLSVIGTTEIAPFPIGGPTLFLQIGLHLFP